MYVECVSLNADLTQSQRASRSLAFFSSVVMTMCVAFLCVCAGGGGGGGVKTKSFTVFGTREDKVFRGFRTDDDCRSFEDEGLQKLATFGQIMGFVGFAGVGVDKQTRVLCI